MVDATQHISLEMSEDPLKDLYSELGEKFEEKLLNITSKFVNSTTKIPEYSYTALDSKPTTASLQLITGQGYPEILSSMFPLAISARNPSPSATLQSVCCNQFPF